jgi:hypothetical protein
MGDLFTLTPLEPRVVVYIQNYGLFLMQTVMVWTNWVGCWRLSQKASITLARKKPWCSPTLPKGFSSLVFKFRVRSLGAKAEFCYFDLSFSHYFGHRKRARYILFTDLEGIIVEELMAAYPSSILSWVRQGRGVEPREDVPEADRS